MSVTATCQNCGLERGLKDTGPCPSCGHQGRDIVANVVETITISERIVATVERNKTKVSVFVIILLCVLFVLTHLADIIEKNSAKLVNGAFYSFLTGLIGYYAIVKIKRIKIAS